jgi:oxygen-independent coproporphyrinogen-3 oxidase
MFGIYIHIPFCLKKCAYCDFHSLAVAPKDVPQKEYALAVCAELEKQAAKHNLRGKKAESIYFGGGTPTLFDVKYLELILNSIHKNFALADNAEITIEANPETLTIARNFNRLSIGVQTFNDNQLKELGRIHNSKKAAEAVKMAQDANFKNISIDLMWGLPEQTINDAEADIDEALKFGVQHISAYQLTLDENMKEQCRQWKLPDEELSRRMWLMAHDKLTAAGYEHYEISNFAQKDFRCLHNMNYWRYGEWLGLGSGASSLLQIPLSLTLPLQGGGKREGVICFHLTTTKNIPQYLRQDFTYEIEEISKKTAMTEYSFLGLRTSDGIDIDEFDAIYPNLSREWIKHGLAQKANKRLSLTIEGMLISNELFGKL